MNTGKITFFGNEIMAAKELRRYLSGKEAGQSSGNRLQKNTFV